MMIMVSCVRCHGADFLLCEWEGGDSTGRRELVKSSTLDSAQRARVKRVFLAGPQQVFHVSAASFFFDQPNLASSPPQG